MKTAIIVIFLVTVSGAGPTPVPAQARLTDCARLERLLDRYANILFSNTILKNSQLMEVREKELLAELRQLNLPGDTKAKSLSLLKLIRQCYGFAGSAAGGMRGFFTDLSSRMQRDARLRENCSESESSYRKLLQEWISN